MEIKLNKLTIENFKGVKKFVLDIAGKNATITAENGIGKTTAMDGFLWCLFGKDSSGDAKFGLRPLDGNNDPIRGLVVAIELELDIDGKTRIFRREQHENVVKKQVRGFTLKCYIDEVDYPITKFNAKIAEIVAEDSFKLLTDLDYFNDDKKFHHTKRREVLLDAAGEISTPKGFDELLAACDGREIEDYKKVLKNRIKAYTADHAQIVPRIDENQLKLDDYAENAIDVTKLEKKRHGLKNDLTALGLQRKNIIADQDARQVKIDDLNELKDSLADRERELKNDTSGVDHLIDEKAEIVAGVAGKLATLTEIEQDIKTKQTIIDGDSDALDIRMKQLDEARKAYLDKKNTPCEKVEEIDKTCPTCNQEVSTDMIEALEYNHQLEVKVRAGKRVEDLKALAKKATGLKEHVTKATSDLETLKAELLALDEGHEKANISYLDAIAYKNQRVTGIDEALANNQPPLLINDPEYKRLNAQIEAAKDVLGEAPADQLEDIETIRTKATSDLETVNESLLTADAIKKVQPRIEELKTQETELAQKIADCEKELEDIKNYYKAECILIEDAVNGKFKHVKFRLFKDLLKKGDDGEADTVPCCDALLNGVPYSDMSDGQKIFTGIDIVNVLSEHFGISVPLFIDRAETFTMDREANSQVIELHAVKGVKKLTVKTE